MMEIIRNIRVRLKGNFKGQSTGINTGQLSISKLNGARNIDLGGGKIISIISKKRLAFPHLGK